MTTDLPGPDAASGSRNPPLNYYGELARRQWEGCLPDVYQQIRDPGAFFAVLGEVIALRIDELADHLAGDDQHGEGYLPKVARLTAARQHAQQRVLGEYLLLPPDEDRPAVVDRSHPSWAEGDAEQQERLGDPPAEGGRSGPRSRTARSSGPGCWPPWLPCTSCPPRSRDHTRREHPAGSDLELLPDRLASRAAPHLHDAAQGTPVATRCLTGVPSPSTR